MMAQCHSGAMFHDYRLRGGSGGTFSLGATRKNYALSLAQLSLESDDIGTSRLVRKNLYRPDVFTGGTGIAHRGGALFEDFGNNLASGAVCDTAKYDYDNGPIDQVPPYCMIREWHRRERAARNLTALSAIVYVKRPIPSGGERAQDFDLYTPGAQLHVMQATIDATGTLKPGADTDVTSKCGLAAGSADLRRPAVSWDGKKIAFAARAAATEPLAIYEMNADGSACAKIADIDNGDTQGNGLLIHNFDPAYSPTEPDGSSHIVFASTRGNLANAIYDYHGPQRTPADPTKPNANLYAYDGPGRPVRQLTYLLNMERYPSFMSDGRVIMTTEKRSPGFYELALRRINLDGGDYHPLYSQRATIGAHQATQAVELSDKNFAAIFSDTNAPHGGGTLGLFNRSIGVDFTSGTAADYVVDGSVIDPAAPASPEPQFFIHSLAKADSAGGFFFSPAPLPNGRVLVSFGGANGDYDVYVFDPATGTKTKVFGDVGTQEIEAVAVYARASRGIFQSTPDEPNGHTEIVGGHAEADVTFLDVSVFASLLFQNTPTGRLLDDDIKSFVVYEDLPPAQGVTSFGAGGANVASDQFGQVYVRRRPIGQVNVLSDHSAHVVLPGGLPIVLKMPSTQTARDHNLPAFQREEMMFAPGEYVHQSMPRDFFDGLCAGCHGSVSGRQLDFAVRPDVLTQASDVQAASAAGDNLMSSARGVEEGP
jgi:hypothetical protein